MMKHHSLHLNIENLPIVFYTNILLFLLIYSFSGIDLWLLNPDCWDSDDSPPPLPKRTPESFLLATGAFALVTLLRCESSGVDLLAWSAEMDDFLKGRDVCDKKKANIIQGFVMFSVST